MNPGNVIAGAAFVTFVALLAVGIWSDPIRPWIEERRWRRDENWAAEQLRLDRSGSRLVTITQVFEDIEDELWSAFDEVFPGLLDDETDELEALFALPCAPNPVWRIA